MTEYIVLEKKSIPDLLCTTIIELFEKEEHKCEGVTLSGVNKKVKKTTDFVIPKNNEVWKDIEKFLYEELSRNIKKYKKKIMGSGYDRENNYNIEYDTFENAPLFTESFMIQKYEKNNGKYVYHNDFARKDNSHRVITFLWYLNTVEEGGETVFWDNYKIRPEEGNLLLFPATWTYPHTGKMPLSDNKYIITGWLSIQNSKQL